MLFGVPDTVFQVGAWFALASAVVWLVLTGRLVPRSQLDDVRADRDQAVARADAEKAEWRLAYERVEQARHLEATHTGQLLRANEVATNVIAALPGSREGNPDASTVA